MSALCRDCLTLFDIELPRCPSCASPRLVRHSELCDLHMAHLDCDAFYASVEKRDRPELRDKPLIIGGAQRGVVTTACYIARISGVRSAMPMFTARRLCPDAVILPPDFAKYRAASREIFERVRALTPLVQPLALDEAWMDLSGTQRLHGAPPAVILARLQNEIERDVGVTVSVGLGPNKFLAKIASDLDKPRGFAVIGKAEAQAFLAPRPVSILPGVGPALARSLQGAGLNTVGDLVGLEISDLGTRFGATGLRLGRLARGEDNRGVNPAEARKSVGAETTFFEDLTNLSDLEDQLLPLCDRVARQLRASGIAGRVITLKLRTAAFQLITRRQSQARTVQTAKSLFQVAGTLLRGELRGTSYRLIGVSVSGLTPTEAGTSELFAADEYRALVSETAVDKLRDRFGTSAVVRGRNLPATPATKGRT